jgi:16S rRNA (uracil1498-N3)-methyltransferase
MRLHRFFIDEPIHNKKITLLDKDLIHQLKNVFRLQAGDELIVLDNSGSEYLSKIELLSKEKAELTVLESKLVHNVVDKNIWILASLIKKDNFEWILEKCTELGVAHFIPIISERSEKKDLNMERAHKILKEASEQSGRGTIPGLYEILTLEDAVNYAVQEKVTMIAFHLSGTLFNDEIKKQYQEKSKQQKIEVLIGPEGGWSDKEIEFLKSKNIPVYSLGNQVLRAETAAVAISSLLLL